MENFEFNFNSLIIILSIEQYKVCSGKTIGPFDQYTLDRFTTNFDISSKTIKQLKKLFCTC